MYRPSIKRPVRLMYMYYEENTPFIYFFSLMYYYIKFDLTELCISYPRLQPERG